MFCNDGLSLEFRATLVALLSRAIAAACARLGAPPPWLPDTGCRGVLVPVFDSDVGGTMLPGESLRSDGICGSDGIDPSFCKSRSLISRRFTCRSSCMFVSMSHATTKHNSQVLQPFLIGLSSPLVVFGLVRNFALLPSNKAPPSGFVLSCR